MQISSIPSEFLSFTLNEFPDTNCIDHGTTVESRILILTASLQSPKFKKGYRYGTGFHKRGRVIL